MITMLPYKIGKEGEIFSIITAVSVYFILVLRRSFMSGLSIQMNFAFTASNIFSSDYCGQLYSYHHALYNTPGSRNAYICCKIDSNCTAARSRYEKRNWSQGHRLNNWLITFRDKWITMMFGLTEWSMRTNRYASDNQRMWNNNEGTTCTRSDFAVSHWIHAAGYAPQVHEIVRQVDIILLE